ncbi:MAG: hypothetical protein RIK87_11525 [Fuerstiella sp.]
MNIDFRDCLVTYSNHGISFSYPDIWELTEEQDGDDVLLTVTCNATCFWVVRLIPACPPPPQVVDSCVDAFEQEYEDLEIETPDASLAEMPACARDLQFFCVELMNSVGLRSVRTSDFTVLVWWQGTHHELGDFQQMLDHMTESLRLDSLLD